MGGQISSLGSVRDIRWSPQPGGTLQRASPGPCWESEHDSSWQARQGRDGQLEVQVHRAHTRPGVPGNPSPSMRGGCYLGAHTRPQESPPCGQLRRHQTHPAALPPSPLLNSRPSPAAHQAQPCCEGACPRVVGAHTRSSTFSILIHPFYRASCNLPPYATVLALSHRAPLYLSSFLFAAWPSPFFLTLFTFVPLLSDTKGAGPGLTLCLPCLRSACSRCPGSQPVGRGGCRHHSH